MKPIYIAIITLITTVAFGEDNKAEPAELRLLRQRYHQELNRVTKPVTNKFRLALEAMKEKYTTAGNLEEALHIKNELDATDSAVIPTGHQLVGILCGKNWRVSRPKKTVYRFSRNGTASNSGQKDLKWYLLGPDTVVIMDSSSNSCSFKWSSKENIFRGHTWRGYAATLQ